MNHTFPSSSIVTPQEPLFGPVGYGRIIGRIARPALVITAVAPVVIAAIAERASDPVALVVAASFAVVALICFVLIRR